ADEYMKRFEVRLQQNLRQQQLEWDLKNQIKSLSKPIVISSDSETARDMGPPPVFIMLDEDNTKPVLVSKDIQKNSPVYSITTTTTHSSLLTPDAQPNPDEANFVEEPLSNIADPFTFRSCSQTISRHLGFTREQVESLKQEIREFASRLPPKGRAVPKPNFPPKFLMQSFPKTMRQGVSLDDKCFETLRECIRMLWPDDGLQPADRLLDGSYPAVEVPGFLSILHFCGVFFDDLANTEQTRVFSQMVLTVRSMLVQTQGRSALIDWENSLADSSIDLDRLLGMTEPHPQLKNDMLQLAGASSDEKMLRICEDKRFSLDLERQKREANQVALTELLSFRQRYPRAVVYMDLSNGASDVILPAVNYINETPIQAFEWAEGVVYSQEAEKVINELGVLFRNCQCAWPGCEIEKGCQHFAERRNGNPFFADGVLFGGARKDGSVLEECNKKCRCPLSCANRVIQHGRRFPLMITFDESKGWSCISLSFIPRGSFVSEYTGECIDIKLAGKRSDQPINKEISYLFDIDVGRNEREPTFSLDARYKGNESRFFNHSCDPNLIVRAVITDVPEYSLGRLAFFAASDIPQYQELTFDYNYKITGVGKLACYCGTTKCRKFLM
ncbi:MAG: SET domain-containing protein-lysine N-methyltransferase, partial [archaeon]|nr:SET domain-containing protein-lysine N-methyltransferase [archaeon]